MKKNIFAMFALVFLSAICLTACNSTSSVSGKFEQESYVVSLNDTINFYDELSSLKGVEKSDITLEVSNSDVLYLQENGNIEAISSGESIIFAKYQDMVFAETEVIVKYKFTTPTNLSLQEDGTLTWQDSFVRTNGENGEIIYAQDYLIEYADVTGLDTFDENSLTFSSATVQDSFVFENIGSYYVKLTALGQEENYIDSSESTEGQLINYRVMGNLENVSLSVSQDFNNAQAILSWDEKADVVYQAYINGFKVQEWEDVNSFTYDYSLVADGQTVNVRIVAKDKNGTRIESSTALEITKLSSPVYQYGIDGEEQTSYIYWEEVENANSYQLFLENIADASTELKTYTNSEISKINLEELRSGIYSAQIISVGGNGENGYFLNSTPSQNFNLAKLSVPSPTITFEGSVAKFEFNEDVYNDRYLILYADQQRVVEGSTCEIELSGLKPGEYIFTVIALPRLNGNEILPYEYNDITTSVILSSDAYTFSFSILEPITTLSHSLSLEQDISTFTFNKVNGSNYYQIYINNNLVPDAVFEENGETISTNITNLNNYIPNDDNQYIIRVVAGLREGDVEHAVLSTREKVLTILSPVTGSEEQTNGFYSWNALDNEYAYYEYQIFKTESDYIVGSDAQPIQVGGTSENITNEELGFGYYVIKIKSVSTNYNYYLDSTFYEQEKYFQTNFLVYKQIETPRVSFFNDNGTYKLLIDSVQYAGGFDVYVDGALEKSITFTQENGQAEYVFSNTFEQAGEYNIEVIANCGQSYDSNLHTSSQAYTLSVTRLAQPQFEVSEELDFAGRKTAENLIVSLIENASYAVIEIDGVVVNGSNNGNVYNVMEQDNDFIVGLHFVAEEAEGDNYYLDSHTREITFNRVASPTDIYFSDGTLSWNNVDTNVENYYIAITLENSINGNSYYRRLIEGNNTSFALQNLINELCEENITFASNYQQAESVMIELVAHRNSFIGEIYYLPSKNGTTIGGQNALSIYKLGSAEITFNADDLIVSWSQVAQGAVYDIYVNNSLVIEDYTNVSINLSNLGTFDFTTAKSIYVKSKHAEYLSSADSNVIYVKELASINSINISSNNGEYFVSFALSQDLSNTLEVQVNGSSENVNFTAGNSSGNFSLNDFSATSFTLQVIAQNDSNTYFYYNSKQTTYQLIDLETLVFTPSISDGMISWNAIANDFEGENINPITYTLTITCNGQTYFIQTTANQYDLQDIESQINVLLSEDVEIVVTARVERSYSLTGNNARGYYGENTGAALSTEKITEISEIALQVVDRSSETTMLDKKLNAYVTLTWQDLWAEIENINFEVTISSGNLSQQIIVEEGTVHSDYTLTKSQGSYTLTIYNTYLTGSSTTFSIRVASTNYITSESTSASVSKIDDITQISVDQDGILTIIDEGNYSYLLQVTVNNRVAERTYSFTETNKQIDLMVDGLLKDGYGSYSIEVLAYDENSQYLPSQAKQVLGNKLQGIQNYQVEDDGYLYIYLYPDNFTDMQFILQTTVNSQVHRIFITPDSTEMQSNVYSIYLLDIMTYFPDVLSGQAGEYIFEIATLKQGSVRSDFVSVTIDYQIDEEPTLSRGLDLTKDYIVFNIPENDNTVSVNIKLYVYNGNSYQQVNNIISYSAEDIRGWWGVDSETGDQFFSYTRDDLRDTVSYTECYAISVNELLSVYNYGQFYLEIARLGKTGEQYVSYMSHSFELFKLNRIHDEVDVSASNIIKISNNYLSWSWEAADGYEGISHYNPTAFYVIFESQDESDVESFQVMSYLSSLNLQEVNLIPGKTYYIYVVAASSESQFIASNRSISQVEVMKYTTPLSLDVNNGLITFEEQGFMASEFMQEITNYFSTSSHQDYLYDLMGNRNFTNPFYFFSEELAGTNLTLRFTLKDSTGADTNTHYNLTLPASYLFPDIEINNSDFNVSGSQLISYFELLQAYSTRIENISTTSAENFKAMVEALMESNRGYAGNDVLFDDLGRSIPSGEYSLYVYQQALNGRTIDSDMSSATTIFITASPSISLAQEQDSEGGNIYTATFGTTETYIADAFDGSGNATHYTMQTTTQYRMLIRYDYAQNSNSVSFSNKLELNLVYLESGWRIYLGETELVGVISDVESSGTIPGFKINITTLRSAVDGVEGQSIITNTAMRIDVYALSGNDGYVVNGKSAFFNLRYLDLPTDSITFQNGTMYIRTNIDDNSTVLMRYLAVGSEQSQILFPMRNGEVTIDLPRAGAYRYIVLSLNGSISYNTINVESETYAIENLYKLNTPSMSTQNNNLYVTYNPNDFTYTQDQSLQFNLANNVSRNYYYQSILYNSATSAIVYEVGSKNTNGQPTYSSELTATQFQSYLLGNSGTFESTPAGEGTSHGADYVWTFITSSADGEQVTNATMLFSSEEALVNARMLNVINGSVYIENGNVVWNIISDTPEIEDGQIIYNVTVNYFKQVIGDNELDVTYEYQISAEYYTSQQILAADNISQDYDFYTIDVTPMGARVLSEQEGITDPRAIQTVEGDYCLIYESVNYQGSETQVLKGNTVTIGSSTAPISRTNTPVLSPSSSIINNGVANGNIIYYITTEDYGADSVTEEQNDEVASRTIIRARYTQAGQEYTTQIAGTFIFTSSSSADTSGYIMVTFTPSEGQLNNISPFDILVQMYAGDKLVSKALIIENVYKMSAFQDGYYEIRLSGDSTIIDFTNYFRYVSIASDNTFYQIVIEFTTPEGIQNSVITSSSSVKTFEITNNITNISIQVRDNQNTSTVNRLLLLYSDTLRYAIERTEVMAGEESLINITWDSQNYRFNWNWTDERTSSYEYYYEIVTDGVGRATGTTSHNYFMPHDRGTITSFLIKARQISEEESSAQTVLYIYSDSIYYEGTNVLFDLFSGGNGSQTSPYQISSSEDFYNISKRNVADEVFYFRFTTDIDIDFASMVNIEQTEEGSEVNFLIKEFYGSLDGNGYRLTFTAEDLYSMDTPYSTNITGLGELNFTSYFALFETIASSATISSLYISIDIDITELNNTAALIAPLALYNYGTVSGVIVSNLSISRLTGERNANYIFIGGLVALNYGTITNSSNNSDVSFTMPQRLPLYLGYAGIAIFNINEGDYVGTISNSYNRGDVSITATTSNVNIYGSGIVMNNEGILERVGNNGNFTMGGTVSTATYFTGIALYSEGGNLSYCYNNGQFTGSTSASLYTAGIAYTLNSGTINYLVDTQGYALVVISRVNPTDTGTNYASVSSGTNIIDAVELTVVTINCGNGYYLRIQSLAGGYVASIGR